MQVKFAAPSGLEAADKQAFADAGGGGVGGGSKSARIADRMGGQRAAKTGLVAAGAGAGAGFASVGRAGFKRFVKAQGDVSEVVCLSVCLSVCLYVCMYIHTYRHVHTYIIRPN